MTDDHHKTAAVKAAGHAAGHKAGLLARARPYRPNPLLVKPGKRTRQEALPTALHMSICVGFSLLVFAVINICVTEIIGRRSPWTGLVQRGTMMAMLTVTVLATPNLGNSFTKAFQRIVGVMIGGWLFYAVYAACQEWWFLVICLSLWAFVLVALSFYLTGREFLFPVALVTAFIVVCNFDTVQQARTMTAVKTVAFAGAILLYTLVSLLLYPLTATQQLLSNLATALRDIQQLADIVVVTGESGVLGAAAAAAGQPSEGTTAATDAQLAPDTAAATDNMQAQPMHSPQPDTAAAGGKNVKPPSTKAQVAVSLAANANHKLQLVQSLLVMTKRERYYGKIGNYKCFLPTVFQKTGVLPEAEVLAVVVNASQVLRVLITVMSDFGSVPMSKRLPPAHLRHENKAQLLPLAQTAVACLQDISAALPVTGPSSYPVPVGTLHTYAEKLQELVAATVDVGGTKASVVGTAVPLPSTETLQTLASGGKQQETDTEGAPSVAGRWQKAAIAASGITPRQQKAQQLALLFSALLSDSVTSEEGQLARWCSVLVMVRQLGRSIAGLNDSLNEMLIKLPWMDSGALTGAAL